MVAAPWQGACLGALAISLLAVSACSSFDPVKATRYMLLNADNYDALDISDAHWVAFDEQHSFSAACTNGAAGNHAPKDCSEVYAPWSGWKDPKCPPSEAELSQGYLADPGSNGAICIQGVLRRTLACNTGSAQCFQANGLDVSNMWGAGLGLTFSKFGKDAWSAPAHKVRGVAFDFSGSEETRLNLRVGIPIVLAPDIPVPSDRPFMRSDGSVLGTDGNIYNCDSTQSKEPRVDRSTTTLKDALVEEHARDPVTSERHSYGSAFWQSPSANPSWGSSPVEVGHNEFAWSAVQQPPEAPPHAGEPDPYNYPFSSAQILGIHFQVVPPPKGNKVDLNFAFCIRHLALLLEE
jgi:hypothetical protein